MSASISFRNITRNIARNKFILTFIFVIFALLLMVNSFVSTISDSFYKLYTTSLTADLSISASGEDFTLFGNSALLVGEFLPVPLIADIENIIEFLNAHEAVNNWAGVLTLPVHLRTGSASGTYIAFGVDFDAYRNVLPGIHLHSGAWPERGNGQRDGLAYTMLQQHQYEKLGEPAIGSQLLLTMSDGSSFTIRETTLSGTYSYSAEDALMQNIILTDADIIRSLAGYVSFPQNGTISTEQQEGAEVDVDDLFSELPQESAPQNSLSAESALESAIESEGLQLSDVEDILSLTPERLAGRQIKESAWHFILIARDEAHSFNRAKFEQFGITQEHRLLNWRNTAGGDALITFFLQILVNGGVGLVLMCIAFVTMNMISLSILERKREFGTMRALGATRMRIAGYMAGEVFFMIVPVIVLGLLCGSLCTAIINSRAIVLNDRYISLLFGSNTLRGSIDMRLIVSHIVLGMVFILLCIPYPLTKILNIQPFKAMS